MRSELKKGKHMERMTVEKLQAFRKKQKEKCCVGASAGRNEIIVGMATCGIAAGANQVIDTFREELKKNQIDTFTVRSTGCLGLCHVEPTVEVWVDGMPPVVYGNVDVETARRIVRKHIVDRELLDGHIYDRPAADLVVGVSAQKE